MHACTGPNVLVRPTGRVQIPEEDEIPDGLKPSSAEPDLHCVGEDDVSAGCSKCRHQGCTRASLLALAYEPMGTLAPACAEQHMGIRCNSCRHGAASEAADRTVPAKARRGGLTGEPTTGIVVKFLGWGENSLCVQSCL